MSFPDSCRVLMKLETSVVLSSGAGATPESNKIFDGGSSLFVLIFPLMCVMTFLYLPSAALAETRSSADSTLLTVACMKSHIPGNTCPSGSCGCSQLFQNSLGGPSTVQGLPPFR